MRRSVAEYRPKAEELSRPIFRLAGLHARKTRSTVRWPRQSRRHLQLVCAILVRPAGRAFQRARRDHPRRQPMSSLLEILGARPQTSVFVTHSVQRGGVPLRSTSSSSAATRRGHRRSRVRSRVHSFSVGDRLNHQIMRNSAREIADGHRSLTRPSPHRRNPFRPTRSR